MQPDYSSKSNKFLALILGIVFFCILVLIVLSFLSPKSKTNLKEKIVDYSISQVWTILHDKTYYLNSKREISKFLITDSICPSWKEYYTDRDSIENYCSRVIKGKAVSYGIINRKYEQVNGIAIRLDSLSLNKTKITIAENSRFFNASANIYFQLFHPNTVIDYEFVKITNSLLYMDSISYSN